MNFVSIDFETADISRESACSVGLVKFINGKKADFFYSLIRPPYLYIRPDFTEIHGLTVDDVKDAPTFADIWESAVKPFIGGLPLAAHNAQFDMGVLRAAMEWYGIELPIQPYLCTLKMARRVWPELESHALSALAGTFGIVYDAHNALEDAETCGKLVQMAAKKYQSDGVSELLAAVSLEMERL
ncbi:MAG: 3'-5' exonuclease [Spirochaetaceae bacterium]|jgi:DNA polymerase-3 subunit epsilon|nr:3'-5' exonuclease [Spirochaetaceae bacterium]